MPTLGRTGLDVFGICLGGNVFGWTADEAESHAVLDAYAGAMRSLDGRPIRLGLYFPLLAAWREWPAPA